VAVIDSRIAQLLAVEAGSKWSAIFSALCRAWRTSGPYSTAIRATVVREALEGVAELRCTLAVGFRFHNALLTKDGGAIHRLRVRGWDDPAKTAGDFFAQIAVPVPPEYFERFVTRCVDVLPDPKTAARRATLMRPAYEVKWCCIALNVFLPVHLRGASSQALDWTRKQSSARRWSRRNSSWHGLRRSCTSGRGLMDFVDRYLTELESVNTTSRAMMCVASWMP